MTTAPSTGPSAPPRVGMVGAGQLARMSQQAAIQLGIELVVLATDPADPAARVVSEARIGRPDDLEALRRLAGECDVVTFDHEGVPRELIETLEAEGHAVRPGSVAKRVAQDKLHARRLLGEQDLPVPDYAPVAGPDDVRAHGESWGWPVVLKACTGGYDGRGVRLVEADDVAGLDLGGTSWMVEPVVQMERELSQIVVRAPGGEIVTYPLVETVQREGICVETRSPAGGEGELEERCGVLGRRVAEAIGAIGVMALELFLTRDGKLLVNELALRPHNSGHLTIEGCVTSQFENHLRAVLGLPLGATDLLAPAVAMVNLLGPEHGDPAQRLAEGLTVGEAHVHLYGKESRPGRKIGHVTALGQSPEEAVAAARLCAERLGNGVPAVAGAGVAG